MTTLAAKIQTRVNMNKDRGATAVEYGLMVALIAVAIIVAVTTLGTKLSGLFDERQQQGLTRVAGCRGGWAGLSRRSRHVDRRRGERRPDCVGPVGLV